MHLIRTKLCTKHCYLFFRDMMYLRICMHLLVMAYFVMSNQNLEKFLAWTPNSKAYNFHSWSTSNVTSITEVRNASACLFAGTWQPLVSVITTLYYVAIMRSLSSVVSHAFSVLCVYLKFRHHPCSLGYLVLNFVFFTASIAKLAHGEKSHINQSLTHPAYLMPWEPKRLRFGKIHPSFSR